MKPLRLTLQGLRAYRDETTVDFQGLAAAGLFGIVGPTGAGKSTLLDALFLALYGETPRGGRSAAEAAHPDAAAVVVELTFDAVRDGQSARWRVRREWRRRPKGELVAGRAELERLLPEPAPLFARGAREVTDAVERDVLGIPLSDFRRAVVLPQGEFDRLLHATPKDRADLLGRIFGLSRLGRPLHRLAADRLSALETRRATLEARLDTLGGDGPAVEGLETSLADATTALAEARDERARGERLLETRQQGLQLARALAAAEADRARIEEETRDLPALAARIERAERALPLLPLLERREEEAARHAEQVRALDAGRTALERATEQAARSRAALESRALAWSREEAALDVRRVVEARAVEQADEATALARRTREAEERRVAAEADVAGVQATRVRLDERRSVLRAALDTWERTLAELRVDAAERARLRQAEEAFAARAQAEDALARATADRVREEAERRRRSEALDEARSAVRVHAAAQEEEATAAGLFARLPALDDAAEGARERTARAVHLVDRLDRAEGTLSEAARRKRTDEEKRAEAQSTLERLRAEASAARTALVEAREARARAQEEYGRALDRACAVRLAEQLVDGDACLVCGATEHPGAPPLEHDLTTPTAARDAAETLAADAATREARAVAREDAAAREVVRAEERTRDSAAEEARALDAREELLAALRELLPGRAIEPSDAGPLLVAELTARRDEAIALARDTRRELDALRARVDAARGAAAAAASRVESLVADVARLDDAVARTRLAEQSAREIHDECLARSAALAWSPTAEELSARRLDIDARDRRGDELSERAGKGRRELAEVEGGLVPLALQEQELRALHDRLRSECDRNRTLHEECTRRVREAVGADDPRVRLAHTCTALADGRERFERLEQEDRDAEAARVELVGRVEALVAACAVAADRKAAADAALAAQLAQSGLDAPALGHLREETNALVQLRATFDDRRRLRDEAEARRARARDDAAAFGGTLPTEAEVVEARDALERANGLLEEALRTVSALETRLADAQRRADEARTVRTELDQLAPDCARAERLELLLRGERFVAFAADRQLTRILAAATGHLRRLSGDRYQLVRASDGTLAVGDRHAAGAERSVSTLSGGESFLVSLALALALSDRIQENGRVRFDFFFLDEGFSALDESSLAAALDALDRLRGRERVVGTISHLAAVQERLPRRLVVERAPPGGTARLRIESAGGA